MTDQFPFLRLPKEIQLRVISQISDMATLRDLLSLDEVLDSIGQAIVVHFPSSHLSRNCQYFSDLYKSDKVSVKFDDYNDLLQTLTSRSEEDLRIYIIELSENSMTEPSEQMRMISNLNGRNVFVVFHLIGDERFPLVRPWESISAVLYQGHTLLEEMSNGNTLRNDDGYRDLDNMATLNWIPSDDISFNNIKFLQITLRNVEDAIVSRRKEYLRPLKPPLKTLNIKLGYDTGIPFELKYLIIGASSLIVESLASDNARPLNFMRPGDEFSGFMEILMRRLHLTSLSISVSGHCFYDLKELALNHVHLVEDVEIIGETEVKFSTTYKDYHIKDPSKWVTPLLKNIKGDAVNSVTIESEFEAPYLKTVLFPNIKELSLKGDYLRESLTAFQESEALYNGLLPPTLETVHLTGGYITLLNNERFTQRLDGSVSTLTLTFVRSDDEIPSPSLRSLNFLTLEDSRTLNVPTLSVWRPDSWMTPNLIELNIESCNADLDFPMFDMLNRAFPSLIRLSMAVLTHNNTKPADFNPIIFEKLRLLRMNVAMGRIVQEDQTSLQMDGMSFPLLETLELDYPIQMDKDRDIPKDFLVDLTRCTPHIKHLILNTCLYKEGLTTVPLRIHSLANRDIRLIFNGPLAVLNKIELYNCFSHVMFNGDFDCLDSVFLTGGPPQKIDSVKPLKTLHTLTYVTNTDITRHVHDTTSFPNIHSGEGHAHE